MRNFILDGISFANDADAAIKNGAKEALKFGGQVVGNAALGLGEGLMDTVDMAGDFVGHTADAGAALLGKETNFGSTKGGIDMLSERVNEGMGQMKDMMKTKIGDTVVGGMIADGAGIAGEIASPMGIINKGVKGIKIAKETANALKKSPEAMAKIRSLMETAQKTGKAVEQSQVDEILQSYSIGTKGKVLENASRVAMKAPDKAQLIDLIKNSPDLTKDEMLKNWPKLQKILSTSPGTATTLLNQISEFSDKDYGDFINNIEMGSSDGTPSSKPEVKPEDKTAPTPTLDDSGITLPTGNDMNPSKDSKFNVDPNAPDTIDAKKKELQLMKEKNAGTLNASSSVVDLMKMLGANSSQEARKILFEELTSQPYTASAEDNIKLKALVEEMFANGTLSDKIQSFKR